MLLLWPPPVGCLVCVFLLTPTLYHTMKITQADCEKVRELLLLLLTGSKKGGHPEGYPPLMLSFERPSFVGFCCVRLVARLIASLNGAPKARQYVACFAGPLEKPQVLTVH